MYRMQTIQLEKPVKFRVIEESEPRKGPGEALVSVRSIGVCGTDIHAFHGRQPFFEYPRVLGHELGVDGCLPRVLGRADPAPEEPRRLAGMRPSRAPHGERRSEPNLEQSG